MKIIKIYGLQRSGTNYLSTLLQKNFDVEVWMNLGGWKHGFINKNPSKDEIFNNTDYLTKLKYKDEYIIDLFSNKQVNFLCIVKNPYNWLISYKKFLDLTKKKFELVNSVNLWNDIYLNYINNDITIIRYEDLLNNFNKTLLLIKDKYDLKSKTKNFINENKVLKRNADKNIGETLNEKFINKKINIKEYFSSKELKIINKTLNKDLMKKFNYDYLS